MTETQKIIKYFALAFALFLIVAIVGGILTSLSFVAVVLPDNDTTSVSELKEYSISDVSKLDIDVAAADFEIKTGESFKLTSNHEYLKIDEVSNTLVIEEKKHKWKYGDKNYKVVLTVPVDYQFDEVSINAGASKMNISLLCTDELDFEFGAGEINLDGVTVYKDTDIKGGAGELDINYCTFNNLNMEIGVGESDFTATVIGESSIECGVGECNINLVKDINCDYTLSIEKGIGDVEVDGRPVENGAVIGSGNNKIDINCAIGEVNINFVANNSI